MSELLSELEQEGVVAPNGADVLDDVHAALVKYVAFPSSEAADAVTLFIAATHGQPAWEQATRLLVKSPLKRCGKTRLQEVASELCHRAIKTANISVAALVRSIDEGDPPTFVLDEGDSIFAKRRGEYSEGAEDLRRILNAGYERGYPYLRWNAQARVQEACPTFAMAIIGGIGDFPDTVEDRSVIIKMRRRAPGEQVAQFRRRRAVPPLRELRDRLHSWVNAHLENLANLLEDGELPAEDRQADVWESLVAIADLAGGSWPERARAACRVAVAEAEEEDDATAGERLLVELRDVFGDSDRLSTQTILERLHEIEEAPWGDWYGHPLTPRELARLLRPYGVKSRNIRIGDSQKKGYLREDFLDTWRRYSGGGAYQASQRPNPPESAGHDGDGHGTGGAFRERPSPDQGKSTPRDDGTAGTAGVPKPGQEADAEALRKQAEVLKQWNGAQGVEP